MMDLAPRGVHTVLTIGLFSSIDRESSMISLAMHFRFNV